jgi:diguanylate cyclase (GGDEF)-like protein
VTTVLVSFGTTLLTLLVVGVGVWMTRRSDASTEERMTLVISDLHNRMDSMRTELQAALEAAQQEARRNRSVGELAGSIDLDEVLNRTLDAVGALPGVDAALISITAVEGEPIIEVTGMTREEAEEYGVAAPPRGDRLRAVTMSYEPTVEDEGAIVRGLAVPVRGESESLGLISVFTRSSAEPIADLEVELESLALRAGPAIDNARRFREARQLADLDALTSLHNRRYFHETLEREVSRAHRYDRQLALILFDLDDFKAINDRIGHLSGDAVLAETAERVREAVRSADIACRVGGDEFAVVLPESSTHDADQLYHRLRGAVSSRPVGQAGRLFVSAGIAEIQPDDDPTTFFERADEALYRAKELGKGQVVEAEAPAEADVEASGRPASPPRGRAGSP